MEQRAGEQVPATPAEIEVPEDEKPVMLEGIYRARLKQQPPAEWAELDSEVRADKMRDAVLASWGSSDLLLRKLAQARAASVKEYLVKNGGLEDHLDGNVMVEERPQPTARAREHRQLFLVFGLHRCGQLAQLCVDSNGPLMGRAVLQRTGPVVDLFREHGDHAGDDHEIQQGAQQDAAPAVNGEHRLGALLRDFHHVEAGPFRCTAIVAALASSKPSVTAQARSRLRSRQA